LSGHKTCDGVEEDGEVCGENDMNAHTARSAAVVSKALLQSMDIVFKLRLKEMSAHKSAECVSDQGIDQAAGRKFVIVVLQALTESPRIALAP
jgi:hypothetical protein